MTTCVTSAGYNMNVMSLAPMLLPSLLPRIPAPLMKVGLKVVMSGKVTNADGSLDLDRVIAALVAEAKDSDEVARLLVIQGVQLLGYPADVSEYVGAFIYDAPDGERSDAEVKELSEILRSAKLSKEGHFKLPFACVECKRIHVSNNFKLSPNRKPLCIRCGREINI